MTASKRSGAHQIGGGLQFVVCNRGLNRHRPKGVKFSARDGEEPHRRYAAKQSLRCMLRCLRLSGIMLQCLRLSELQGRLQHLEGVKRDGRRDGYPESRNGLSGTSDQYNMAASITHTQPLGRRA